MNQPPDLITVVSNLDLDLRDVSKPAPVRQIKFTSTKQSTGPFTLGVKRNVGAWLAEHENILFFDDDQLATAGMVDEFRQLLKTENHVYGHHRFWDYSRYSVDQLLNVDPLQGQPREQGVNRFHGWQSGFGGLFAIKRDLYIGLGGTDLWFSNKGSSEDQNFAYRLIHALEIEGVFIRDRPVAIHPLFTAESRLPLVPEPSNVCVQHQEVPAELNGVNYTRCKVCPWHRRPVDAVEFLYPMMPFNPLDFEYQIINH